MAVVVGPGRKGPMIPLDSDNSTGLNRPTFECNQDDHTSAIILITLGILGVGANVALMAVILFSKHLRRDADATMLKLASSSCANGQTEGSYTPLEHCKLLA